MWKRWKLWIGSNDIETYRRLETTSTLQRTNTENSKQIFPEKELRGHSPNFHIHVTIMCLWANYIFPPSICLFCCRKYVDRSWEYKNRSQTHECRNWDLDRTIPRKGIHICDFCWSAYVFAVFFLTHTHTRSMLIERCQWVRTRVWKCAQKQN